MTTTTREALTTGCEEALRLIDWLDIIAKDGVEIYKHELRCEAERFRDRIECALAAANAEEAKPAESNPLDTPGNRHPEYRYDGYKGRPLQDNATPDQKLSWKEGVMAAEAKPTVKESLIVGAKAAQKPVALQHMAFAENGVLRWMSGRKIDNCELYAMPDFGRAPKLYAALPAPAEAKPAPDSVKLMCARLRSMELGTCSEAASMLESIAAIPAQVDAQCDRDALVKIASALRLAGYSACENSRGGGGKLTLGFERLEDAQNAQHSLCAMKGDAKKQPMSDFLIQIRDDAYERAAKFCDSADKSTHPAELADGIRAFKGVPAGKPDVSLINEGDMQGDQMAYAAGRRVGLLHAASGVRNLFINHAHHSGANGLLDRCKSLADRLSEEADSLPIVTRAQQVQAEPSAAVPEGWKLVPIEPTHEMLDEAGRRLAENVAATTPLELQADAHTAWDAMLAAAPAQQVQPAVQPVYLVAHPTAPGQLHDWREVSADRFQKFIEGGFVTRTLYTSQRQAEPAAQPVSGAHNWIKDMYGFLESTCPEGFADEVFRVAPEEVIEAIAAAKTQTRNDAGISAFNTQATGRVAIVQPVSGAVDEPTDRMIDDGLEALLQCTSSELESYSPKLLDGYTDDVKRVYKAMRSAALSSVNQVNAAQPEKDADLLDIARTICCVAAHMRDNGSSEHDPSPLDEFSPLLIEARKACLKRGFTADGAAIAAQPAKSEQRG